LGLERVAGWVAVFTEFIEGVFYRHGDSLCRLAHSYNLETTLETNRMESVVSQIFHLNLLQLLVTYMKQYSDMITWSDARQRLCKNVSPITDKHTKVKDIVGSCVFYAARAEVI
jgi:hypothetical protein